MNKIDNIKAEEILDSRGNPTIMVTVSSGVFSGTFSVPSGASTGAHEAHELRDVDGRGVSSAIKNVNEIIAPMLVGQDLLNQRGIDELMLGLDATGNKSKLGGNAIIGVSIACAKAAAAASNLETYEYLRTLVVIKSSQDVPFLYLNLLEGGKHAKNGLAFQEYHIIPNTKDLRAAVDAGIRVQSKLQEVIKKELGEGSVLNGDEGGLDPKISEIRKPLEFLTQAIDECRLGVTVSLALDVAASSFYVEGKYIVDGKEILKDELMSLYKELVEEFKLLSIEDPFDEEDFTDFKKLKEEIPGLLVVGDDITVTNKKLLEKAIVNKSINAIIIKPNQIGTLTETLETMKLATDNDIKLIVSHRSGETMDDFIADLAYAFGAFGLKAGSPMAKERRIKYDRLVNITKK
ncbi:MAG: phosphopyruvate hydratase [Candidatus Pacebacteria bacterium]|nr:phosphopyruvate hydratase [Candidatus Paceibacterota bacterium]